MGVQVQFNPTLWEQTFPELADRVDTTQAAAYFTRATLLHDNTGSLRGPQDPGQQLALLNLVTAHIAMLSAPRRDGQSAPDIVGRITDATEGSVSVSAEMSDTTGQNQAYWQQTKYGAEYWTATAQYRLMRYRGPRRRRNFNFPFRDFPIQDI